MDVGEGISGEGMSGSSLEKEHPGRPQENLPPMVGNCSCHEEKKKKKTGEGCRRSSERKE